MAFSAQVVSPRVRHNEKVCPMCGVGFLSSRKDKVTCGARCRKRYQRKCDGITVAATVPPVVDTITVLIRDEPSRVKTPSRTPPRPARSSKAKLLRKKGKPARTKPARKKGKKK